MGLPTIEDLIQILDGPLAVALGNEYGKLYVSFMSQANTVTDGTTGLLIRDSAGESRAVVLCSATVSPDMVQRAMSRAHQAKAILGASIGAPILDPLAEGRVQGLSYAVLPFCNKLSESRPVWWIQRALLRPLIFDWLWRVTECTVCDVESDRVDRRFAEPLRHLASLKVINDRLRAAAKRAAERLDAGKWTPRHVLMHGDLWKGNILVRAANIGVEWRRWRERFVIIDWAGSETYGYAMYDLVRLIQSMRLRFWSARREVVRHCRVLRCEPVDSMSYLLAALGHIAMNLERFPIDRYAQMTESTFATLEHTLE